MHSTCNVVVMRVCASTVGEENVCLFVRRLRNPPCRMQAPYCDLLSARVYKILSHHLIKVTIFEGEVSVEYKMCIFIFSTAFSEPFVILRRFERHIFNNVN
jgi:hypothetical protein